jgi:hypothetical protein
MHLQQLHHTLMQDVGLWLVHNSRKLLFLLFQLLMLFTCTFFGAAVILFL